MDEVTHAISEWWGAFVAAPVATLMGVTVKRVFNTYTKQETDEQIKLHIKPVEDHLQRNTVMLDRVDENLDQTQRLLAVVEARLNER